MQGGEGWEEPVGEKVTSMDLTMLSLRCLLDAPLNPQSRDVHGAAGHIHLQLEEEMLCAHLGVMSTRVGCELNELT